MFVVPYAAWMSRIDAAKSNATCRGGCSVGFDVKHGLKYHAYRNVPLSYAEAYALGCMVMDGCDGDSLAQIQSLATLCALHNPATYAYSPSRNGGNGLCHDTPTSAADQIAGLAAAVFERDVAKSPSGFLQPNVPYVMDNCGMGGDMVVTANVSTLAAFIAAAAGIPICKHGSPANADQGRHGSSDFIASLGINTFAPRRQVEECVEREGFGYTEALDVGYKRIHLQTHEFGKLPHMNDIIGPMTSPVDPKLLTRRVLGVNHLMHPRVVAEAYQILNMRGITHMHHGMFVRGYADVSHEVGMDEVSICPGGTVVVELIDSELREYRVHAEDFGLAPVLPDTVSPPAGMSKGTFSTRILNGEERGSSVQMILANAALLFSLSGHATTLRQGYELAEETFHSGDVPKKVEAIRQRLPA